MKLIRKGWLALLLLMFVSGGALAQAPDVPPGHWAYDAVRTLLERGYLDAEADGLFHGDDPVSRYALAGLIARLLEDIEAGRVQIGTAADVEMLRRLEGEFRAELVEWHAARQELEEAHAQTQRQIAVIDEQLNNILFALEAVDAELQAMEAAGAQRDQRLDGHDGELAALRDRFAQVQAQLQAAMDELYNSVVTVLGEHSEAVSLSLDQEAAETAAMFAALHARLDDEVLPALADVERRLSNQLAEQQAAAFLQMSQLDERHTRRMDELAAELASVRGMTAELGAALEDLGVVLSTEYRAELDQQAQGFSQAIEAVRGETERLDAVTQRLEQQVEELSSWIARVEEESAADLGNSVAELRAMISMLSGSLEEVQNNLRVVERHTAVLTDAVMDVMSETAALRSDVDALSARLDAEHGRMRADLDAVAEELRLLQGVLGTSEDQINALAERVRQQLEEQLALQLARERQLTRQLEELQAEFSSYRVKTEEELQSARNMGTIGIGAAILAIVLGFAR